MTENSMKAMVLERPRQPLCVCEMDPPALRDKEILIRVNACGICRTDLHIIDGELIGAKLPLIPGHEIVGTVVERGENADRFHIGERVGVPWLGYTDGSCRYCQRGDENLCDGAMFTGYTLDGGYAEYTAADERYCLRIPERYEDSRAAPLLCAGLIGYRAYKMALSKPGLQRLGIYGFGAAAHIIAQVARFNDIDVYAFTRPGDLEAQEFARSLGAVWAGGSDEAPPEELDAAIIFAPVGSLVPAALRATSKGGSVICGGIHMSDIPSIPYSMLWEERSVKSVANLTRRDGEEFMAIARDLHIKTEVQEFKLEDANEALSLLRAGKIRGAAVLKI